MASIWILAIIFIGSYGACFAVASRTGRRQRRLYERLDQLRWEPERPEQDVAEAPGAAPARELLPFVNEALERHGMSERLKWLLAQAGLSLRPGEFVVGTIAATGIGALAGWFLKDRSLTVLLAALGAAAPLLVLLALRARRLAQFGDQLANALTLIASAIRAGHGFLRAMQVAASELPDPIRQELRRSLQEAEIGHPIPVALRNMVRRVPSYDLELAVTAVAIQNQVGGNLSEVLDTIAETIRDRVRTRRQIAALTAEGRLSGWVAFMAPWVMFAWLYFSNHDYLAPFIKEVVGQIALGGALVLQLLGGFVISRMVAVDL